VFVTVQSVLDFLGILSTRSGLKKIMFASLRRKEMNALKVAIPLFVALAYAPAQGLDNAITMGADLASFAVLGAAGVTNVPTSTIGGNLGSAPNPSVDGGYVFSSGSLQQNTGIAQSAQAQLDTAIFDLNALPPAGGTLLPSLFNYGVIIRLGTIYLVDT
jgi:hypothetical protein